MMAWIGLWQEELEALNAQPSEPEATMIMNATGILNS